MRPFFILLVLCFAFSSCEKKREDSNFIHEKDIVNILLGEYDNFQQAWQENKKNDIHRVEVEEKHQHIHSKFEPIFLDADENEDIYILATHSAGRDSSNILGREIYHFWSMAEDGGSRGAKSHQAYTYVYQIPDNQSVTKNKDDLEEHSAILTWEKEGETYLAKNRENQQIFSIKKDTLNFSHLGKVFKNKSSGTYQMLKCRFFSGWIEYPVPDIPDSTYKMANLKIHDQGGIVQLRLPEGKHQEYSIELTQLVFGKKLGIMKLAVYEMPENEVEWNSRSVSYTWTNPESKRIGINLRKVVSGWTFIEEGYISSNNTNWKK